MGRHFFVVFGSLLERGTKKKNKNAIFVFVFDVPFGTTLYKLLGLVAGWPKQKARGRMLQPAGLAGQAGLCWGGPFPSPQTPYPYRTSLCSVRPVRPWPAGHSVAGLCWQSPGSGGTGRGHPATEANILL